MSATSTPRRKSTFPGSLTDLHRFRKTVHGHDGSSRIVMVRKTDQRTFAHITKGKEPKLETITRETIETFKGQRTECKITTETKDCDDLIGALNGKATNSGKRTLSNNNKKIRKSPIMGDEFQIECLNAHNEYRKRHNVPALKLDKDICKVAQQWANYLINKNGLQHNSNNNNKEYGENLFVITSSDENFLITGREPVDNWYKEIENFKFGIEPKSLSSGHFTQIVWKDSEKLGVAYAKYGRKTVVVANYYPPGNIIGEYNFNVPPLGGFKNNEHNNNNNNNNEISKSFSTILSLNKKPLLNKNNKFPIRLSSSSSNNNDGTEGNFYKDFLNAHNEYRKKHNVPLLKLDKKLCKYAEEWAKHLATKNILEHRPNCNYGENIYCMYSSDPKFTITGHSPVDKWYEEVQYHPFGKEPNGLKSGHFTQVIWKSSELLGVGVSKNSQGHIYVVANYSPAGNFVGHFIDNVPAPAIIIDNDDEKNLKKISQNDAQEEFNQFALEGLKVHNEYRKKHGVPELKLTKKMCQYAQQWADTCAKTASMCHRANNPYGENIFCVYSSDYSHTPTARDAIKQWYDEVKKYNFGIEYVNHSTLHFTQIVWKNTIELGFAMGKNKKGETYVVANYHPRGNIIGQFLLNVPRPRF